MISAADPAVRARAALEGVAFGSVAVTSRALAAVHLELTFAQWRVLMIAGEQPPGATVTEIANRIGAEISPASRLVRRLVQRGLVAVSKDLQDRRVTRVTMTADGGAIREAVLAQRHGLLARVLTEAGPMNQDDAVLLERVVTAFRRYT